MQRIPASINNVQWTSSSKDAVHALATYDDGIVERLIVTRTDDNPFWQLITESLTVEDIDNFTESVRQESRQRAKIEAYRQQESHVKRKYNDLFSAKIEAFDIPEVINASIQNRSSIRKAKSLTEVYARVAACIIESKAGAPQ
jgi:predicted dehydrogenase